MKYLMKIFSMIVFYSFLFSNVSYGLNIAVTKIPKNDTLNIRKQPKLGAKKIGEFAFNASLIYVSSCENIENQKGPKEWCKVSYTLYDPMDEYYYESKDGWVAKKYLSFSSYKLHQQDKYKYKTYSVIRHQPGEFLNVRIGRGSQYEIIDKLPYNKKDIKIKSCLKTKNGNEWCWISYPAVYTERKTEGEQREGWVSAKYLEGKVESVQIPEQRAKTIDLYRSKLLKKEVGKPFVQIGHLSNVVSVAFSPDDNYILTASEDGTMILWDAVTLKEIHTFIADEKAVTSAVFSPDGNYILSGGEDKTVKLWDVKTGDLLKVLKGHSRGINAVAFSPDGREIISGSTDETIILWDMESEKALSVYKGHESSVLSVAFSPDGNQMVSASWDGTTILWDKDSVFPVKLFEEYKKLGAHLYNVAFSPDGTLIASAAGDGTVQVWNRVSGKKVNTFKGHRGAVRAIAFSSDGNYLLSGGEDKTLKLWDLNSGVEIKSYVGHNEVVKSVAFSYDGNFILSGGLDDTLKLWDIGSGEVLKSSEKSLNVTLNSKLIPNTNKILASYDDHTLKALDLEKANFIEEYIGHSSKIWNFDLILGGKEALSGDDDGNIIHWSLAENTKIKEFKQYDRYSHDEDLTPETIDSLNICENDHYMITRGPTNIYFWDFKNDRLIFAIDFYSYSFLPESRSNDTYRTYREDMLSKLKISYQEFERFQDSLGIGKYDEENRLLDVYIEIGFSKEYYIVLYNKQNDSMEYWDIERQRLIKKENCSKSNNGKMKFSLSIDEKGALVVNDAQENKELVKFYSFADGEWIAITPEGYFNASENGAKYLNVLTGPMSVTSVDAYYETFYRPDIVKAVLAGKKVDTGLRMADIKPAPEVKIVNTPSKVNQEEVKVTLNITEKGGGIGDIRLYLNGVAVKTDSRAIIRKQQNKTVQKHFTLKLPKGKHTIKAMVFNESNTMRSNEAEHTITAEYQVIHQPELHALIIGVNEFKNPKLTLKYAVDDAKLFANTVNDQSKGLFSKTVIHQLDTKAQTTKTAITQKLKELQNLNPDDFFVFYVASHGTVDDGEYFLLTSNVGSTSTSKLKSDAIQQTELKRLIANVPTTKKFIVLDTCNAGAMGDALLTRGMSEDTAMKVLSRAVGSTILAAATSQQEALEGYRGHGLFTYVLAEGLKGKADMDNDGYVKTLEIANYIDEKVPEIAEREFNRAQYPVVSPSGQAFPVGKVK